MFGLSAELKQVFKKHSDKAHVIKQAAVLGCGRHGGGITITSVAQGVPVLIKDITEARLNLGMKEATRQVNRLVKKAQLTQDQSGQGLPPLSQP